MGSKFTAQKRSGAALAYLSTAANTIGTLVLTPLLTGALGISGFGLYQLAIAYAGYLIVLSFGIRIVIAREVASQRAQSNLDSLPQRLSLLRVGVSLPLTLLGLGAILFASLSGPFLSNSVTPETQPEFLAIYWLTVANLAVGFITDFSTGIATGFERFRAVYGAQVARGLARIAIIAGLLEFGFGAVAVAAADLFLSVCVQLFLSFYVRRSIRVSAPLWPRWDPKLATSSFNFGFALMLSGVAGVVTLSMDKVILGALTNTSDVAIYSIALILLTASGTLTLSIGQVFAPGVMRRVTVGSDRASTTSLIVEPGRLQLIIGGTLLCLFILYGEDFLSLWLGNEYLGAYWPAILLMVPNLIISVESLVFAVLDARLKRLVRSVVTVIGAAVNIALTFFLVDRFGMIGAALATAVTRTIFEIVIMNIYYHKYLGVDVPRMFKGISQGILPVLAITTLIFFGINRLIPSGGIVWIIAATCFVICLGAGFWRFGINSKERAQLEPLLKIRR